MSLPAPHEVVPHVGSCVLLERLLAADAQTLRATVHVTPTPWSLACGGLPGWAGLEIMAQAVSAWAGCRALAAGEPIRPGLLLGARSYRCREALLPAGARYEVSIAMSTLDDDGLGVFDCTLDAAGEPVARAALTVFQPSDAARFLEERAR